MAVRPTSAIVVYSFGKRDAALEPNPCNQALGRAALEAVRQQDSRPLIITQWEVAKELRRHGVEPDLVVDERCDGGYLGSEGVWRAARSFLSARDVHTVTPIAHPFLHLRKVTALMNEDGFRIAAHPIGRIGFDSSPQNQQWWTRGPVRLMAYAVAQRLAGARGG